MFTSTNDESPSLIIVESSKKPKSEFLTVFESTPISYLICSPEIALQWIIEFNPKVIIIDLFMPGWNCLNLIRSIFLSQNSRKTRVIVVSSFDYKDVIDQVLSLGVDKFITKPIEKKIIWGLVMDWLNN